MKRRDLLKLAGLTLPAAALPTGLVLAKDDFCLPVGPDEKGRLRLGSNENPYGPSPKAREAIRNSISASNRYPRDFSRNLVTALAKHHGMQENQFLLSGGSSDMLGLIVQLAASENGNIVYPDPTFSSWIPYANHKRMKLVPVPLNEMKQMDLDAIHQQVDKETRMVYLCNPNNPTGTIVENNRLRDTVSKLADRCWVLLDEAYCELDEIPSLQDMIKDHPNLIIVKTFSKVYGLAGARVGYAIAQASTIQKLAALVPWPHSGISNLSAEAAIASLSDVEFVKMCQQKNREARDYTLLSLKKLGIEAIPSYTNFLYFPVNKLKGNYFEYMKENKADIRSWQEKGKTYCRVSIGTLDEMKAFIKLLESSTV